MRHRFLYIDQLLQLGNRYAVYSRLFQFGFSGGLRDEPLSQIKFFDILARGSSPWRLANERPSETSTVRDPIPQYLESVSAGFGE
jgi:hypothetical protein